MFPESKFHAKTFRNGFTLIELLVVIAIIALLVSILLPSLQTAKDLAKNVVCMSNIKGIGTAYSLYAAESDSWLPMCYDGGISGVPAGTYRWRNLFIDQEYAPAEIFECPSGPTTGLAATATSVWPGYGMNNWINNAEWDVKMDSFVHPDKFILIADNNDLPIPTQGASATIVSDEWGLQNWSVAKRHTNESANDLRVDGHVDSRDTYYYYADSDEILWNPSLQNN